MTSHIVRQTLLAEAMGGPIWDAYIHPAKNPGRVDLPDPYTNAEDCDALIAFLLTKNYEISINHSIPNPNVILWEIKPQDIQCCVPIETKFLARNEDWKRGVCDLALKALGIDAFE